MNYMPFFIFMIGTFILYGILFWMWVQKFVSLQLILIIVVAKFVITVGWVYAMKLKTHLENKRNKNKGPKL